MNYSLQPMKVHGEFWETRVSTKMIAIEVFATSISQEKTTNIYEHIINGACQR